MVQENLQDLHNDRLTTVAQPEDSKPRVLRKKFAKPPVKVACLACRASRTRCDGKDPCSNCADRRRGCSYLPSKRGGPRERKRKSAILEDDIQQAGSQESTIAPSSGFQESSSELFGQIDELSIPAAGVRSLDYSSDVQPIFEEFFAPNTEGNPSVQMQPTSSAPSMPMQTLVRAYGSEHELLNAYYVFIHSYFPILPPRVTPLSPDQPLDYAGYYTNSSSEEPVLSYQPQSPLSLAISAILSLVPHPNDPDPTNSVLQRRTCAHKFARVTITSIETDCELQSSSIDPSQALSNGQLSINREPFHPRVPVELEKLLASLILCVYEYTQRGNMLKMKYRAGQALDMVLEMSLHSLGEEHDEFAEARRRAWWMTYYCVLQSSISSTTAPSVAMQNLQVTTSYPQFASDPEGWSILIQAQQVLVSATQFVLELNKYNRTRDNISYIYERMQQLDAWATSVLSHSSLIPSIPQSLSHGDITESITAYSTRAIARIKLSSAQIKIHRFRAFSDIPIFVKKHCDLAAINSNPAAPESRRPSEDYGMANIPCQCSNLEQFHGAPSSSEYTTPPASSTTSDLPTTTITTPQYPFSECPFTSQHSAKVCLRAALLISHMFQCLPLPKPLYTPDINQNNTHPEGLPRTMPSFACCLMQGSYAMLMIFYKARVVKQMSPPGYENANDRAAGNASDRLVEELRQGLERIIAAVRNYTIGFEALVGMRNEIEGAYQTAFC